MHLLEDLVVMSFAVFLGGLTFSDLYHNIYSNTRRILHVKKRQVATSCLTNIFYEITLIGMCFFIECISVSAFVIATLFNLLPLGFIILLIFARIAAAEQYSTRRKHRRGFKKNYRKAA